MRRGRLPAVGRLRALCEVLVLEFYVGRPRETHAIDERHPALALETALGTLREAGVELEPAELALVVGAVYSLVKRKRAPATAARVKCLIETPSPRIGPTM